MSEPSTTEEYELYTRIFHYPHEIIPQGTAAKKIMDRYYELQTQGKEQGYVPFFVRITDILLEDAVTRIAGEHDLPDDEDLITAEHARAYTQSMLEKYRASLEDSSVEERGKIEIAKWLDQHFEDEEEDEEFSFRKLVKDFEKSSFVPEEEDDVDHPEFVSIISFERGDDSDEGELLLVQVPTDNPADVPAYLPFGGWNECPKTESQLAFTHYWYQKYGAVPGMLNGHDTLEFYVERPVTDPGESKQLAVEQFAFCSDIVMQVFNSFEALTDFINRGKQWYFWWD